MNFREIDFIPPSFDQEGLKKLGAFCGYFILILILYALFSWWFGFFSHNFGSEYKDMEPNPRFKKMGAVMLFVRIKYIHEFSQVTYDDIVAYRIPEKEDIQLGRIIAVGGDRLCIKEEKFFINGEEKTPVSATGNLPSNIPEFYIPYGYYYICLDNRSIDKDSRTYGLIPFENIVGETGTNLLLHLKDRIDIL